MKLTDDKIIFKQGKGGKTEQVTKEDIDLVNWQRLAGTWGIRIFTQSGALHRFAGFKEPVSLRSFDFYKQSRSKWAPPYCPCKKINCI